MQLAYLRFCVYFGFSPVPAERQTLILYTAFLARSLSPASIPGYLNVVRLMHCELGLLNPLKDWELDLVRKGIQRKLGRPPKQKLAITPEILLQIYAQLDFNSSFLCAFWAACLVAFYAFLRKSSLLPAGARRDQRYLCRKDIVFVADKDLVMLTVRHSKTIQFGQRVLTIPLSAHPQKELCPFKALQDMLHKLPTLTPDTPLFSYVRANGVLDSLNYTSFVKCLHTTLQAAGYKAKEYSGHSFRRGGCSFAFKLGIPAALIKLRGDWRSNAYERYITIEQDMNINIARILTSTSTS